jgi:hypothetical protein
MHFQILIDIIEAAMPLGTKGPIDYNTTYPRPSEYNRLAQIVVLIDFDCISGQRCLMEKRGPLSSLNET